MSNSLPELPAVLSDAADAAWQSILQRATPEQNTALQQLSTNRIQYQQLRHVLACSRYAAELLERHPDLLVRLLAEEGINRTPDAPTLQAELADALARLGSLSSALRWVRHHQMLRIIWRDLCRLTRTPDTIRDLSELADTCIRFAQQHLHHELSERWGSPVNRHGEPQQLIVLAMGKLGAAELNLSSDIDLIFAYPDAGETVDGRRSISNGEFFTKLGQGLIKALDEVTAEGFAFRVDMRLRPYGDSGPLVQNFRALEAYYEQQGREWERYAMIKARPVSGDPHRAAELMASLRPFVYRRYIDFGVIDSLRGMKRMLRSEVQRRGLHNNVKLGSGGIREVEFIAQCFQLIRGGAEPALQQRELVPVLKDCARLGYLPAAAVDELIRAYYFLRDSEHAIQAWQDRQTQELPSDPCARAALTAAMGFADWEMFSTELKKQRERVARHFANLIAEPDSSAQNGVSPDLWNSDPDVEALTILGYADAPAIADRLKALHNSGRVQQLQSEGRVRLDRFMPTLIDACSHSRTPDLTLERLLPLIESVMRRSAYLVLLQENPDALRELITLVEASPWIAEQVTHYPMLLDELLDSSTLYYAADRTNLALALRDHLVNVPLDDLEQQMEGLRYFKAAQVLRVAACEISGTLPLMKVSDNLTWIAEVIIEHVLQVAWAAVSAAHGEPGGSEDQPAGIAVIGYGKLGGIELSYGSDLDLVFLYTGDPQAPTTGAKPTPNQVFFTRLAQRMIHILEARTGRGQLYEIDMRLRPSGASGLLVATVAGFERYQRDEAWTWEHQALVRARCVAGDSAVAERFAQIRQAVLCQPREQTALALEVVKMRQRMREHLLPRAAENHGDMLHVKQSRGGIVDIEFMVQYLVLAWAADYPALAEWSDNIRILETLEREQLLTPEQAAKLRDAYLSLRSAAHQLALQQAPDIVPAIAFEQHCEAVRAAWDAQLGNAEQASP